MRGKILFFVLSAIVVGLFVNQSFAQKRVAGVSSNRRALLSPQAAGPIRVDDFTYSVGQLTDSTGGANVSGGNWITNTGTGNFLQVTAGSLSYTGYPSSGVGNKLNIISTTASAEDTFRNFPTQTSGTTYAAFMVNVTDTTGLAANSSTTGDYFAGFISSTSTSAFVNRVTIRAGSVANTYQLGIRATGNAGNTQTFSTTDLPVGTTALVVISYQIVSGAANDICKMWVNPVITSPEPAPTLTQTSAADNADVGRFFIRQGSAGTPNASVDGLRVATSWASLIEAFNSTTPVDFNGDGRTDFAVLRNIGVGPGGQVRWFINHNGAAGGNEVNWGIGTDSFVPEDYDGDNKTDIAVWRSGAANVAAFYILNSSNGTIRIELFGQTGDDPTIVDDYDGDGKADPAVFREAAQGVWYYRGSLNNPSGAITFVPWGTTGDTATSGDYDGDGKADYVIQRSAGGQNQFWLFQTTAGTSLIAYGLPSDSIVPGDFDGDRKADIALVRVSGGSLVWYVLPSSTGIASSTPIATFGADTDFIAQGDYDGDGRTDVAVWRPNPDPTLNFFHVLASSNGAYSVNEWGADTDVPVAGYNNH